MQATLDNISIPELKAVVLTHQKMFAQQPGIMNSRFKVVGECGRGVTRVAKTSGCALSGFVLVKKVPGTLHFLAKVVVALLRPRRHEHEPRRPLLVHPCASLRPAHAATVLLASLSAM